MCKNIDEFMACISNMNCNSQVHYIEIEKLIAKFQIEDNAICILFNELKNKSIKIYPNYSWLRHLQDLIEMIGTEKKIASDELNQWFEREVISKEAQYKIQNTLIQAGYSLGKKDIDEIKVFLESLDEDDFKNLDDLLEDDEFKVELEKSKDVIDKSYNFDYITKYKNESGISKRAALENLVLANRNLVWHLVNKYKKFSTSSFDVKDMYQVGMIGLLKTAEKFDLSKDTRFSTYATYWIKQGIIRGIDDNSTTIRIPVHKREKIRKYLKEKEELWSYPNFSGDFEQIKNYLNLTDKEILELEFCKNLANLQSLDTPINEEQDSYLGEIIEDKSTKSPEDVAIEHVLERELLSLLERKLTDRELNVIILRFGLFGGNTHTLEEIGKVYGLTRERIRQIEAKALRKLKFYGKKRLVVFSND